MIDISNVKRIDFRKDLNDLQAIEVLSVVLYHADFNLFKGGWLGVDIFFVISEYLISNIIISELNYETFSFKKFFIKFTILSITSLLPYKRLLDATLLFNIDFPSTNF